MKWFLLFTCLYVLPAYEQLPAVNFNHFFLIIDSADLAAIQHSDFIKNEFAVTTTRTTKADSNETWTGTYFSGLDNYLELFDSTGINAPTGLSGIGFSVDRTGDLDKLDTVLSKKYKTEKWLREKQYDDKKVPWFNVINIADQLYDSLAYISFWVMEYRPEYFNYNNWPHKNDTLNRITYLSQYAEQRKNKILKRFSALNLNTTDYEKNFISTFLLNCGYKEIDDNAFASPENFIIRFIPRSNDTALSIASAEFESNILRNDGVIVSKNIRIQFHDYSGKIIFK